MKKPGTMNFILLITGTFLLAFTVCMILVWMRTGGIPDTLVTCVFAVCGGECGIMGWIRTTKERCREREWEKEDKSENGTEGSE